MTNSTIARVQPKALSASLIGPRMTDVQLEQYIALLGVNYVNLGEQYVARQTAWAESLLSQRGVV